MGTLSEFAMSQRAKQGFVRNRSGTLMRFDYPGTQGATNPTGINKNGDIVGFYYDRSNLQTRSHGFVRRTNNIFASFDAPNAIETFAHAINDRGDIVGAFEDDNGTTRGFVLRADGNFKELRCADSVSTTPTSINNRGQIAGYCGFPDGERAFIFGPDERFHLIEFAGASVQPKSINDDGVIVGTSNQGPFLRSADGTLQILEHPACASGSCTIPTGINNRRQVVGQYQRNRVRGFIGTP
jgi:probable HAF family extracellular repeat protein